MIVAIIPARSGSKRIINKNIKLFKGKPIIAWSIEEALKSKIFSKVLVSTDSIKIARVAKQYGAQILGLRPKNLSGPKTPLNEVMKYEIKKMKKKKFNYKYYCLIYATAPMIEKKDLIQGYKKIQKNKFDFVLSISKINTNILRSLYIKDSYIRPFFKKNTFKNTQDLKQLYCDGAQFCFGKDISWMKKHPFNSKTGFITIPSHRFQDIDNIEDFIMAVKLFKKRN